MQPDKNRAQKVRDQLNILIQNKKFFTAQQIIHEFSSDIQPRERHQLEETIAFAVNQAKDFHTEIEKLVEQGEYKKALRLLDRLTELVTDFPGLSAMHNRIGKLKKSGGSSTQAEHPQSQLEELLGMEEITQKNAPKPKKKRKPIRILTPNPSYTRITIGAICLALILSGAMLYIRDQNYLHYAQLNWELTHDLIKQHQHKQALEAAEKTKSILKDIKLLLVNRKELEQDINNLLISRDFTEGLHGRIYHEGAYLDIEKVRHLKRLQQLTLEADQVAAAGQDEATINAYEKAIRFATTNSLDVDLSQQQQKVNNLRLQQSLTDAKSAESNNQWEDAAATYQKALDLARSISAHQGERTAETTISKRLATAIFKQKFNKSRELFAKENWQQTLELLEIAKKSLDSNPSAASRTESNLLNRLIIHTKLYLLLSEAKKAYEHALWDTAITKYHNCLDLIKKEKRYFADNLGDSLRKIRKIILMAKISKELNTVTFTEQDGDLNAPILHYQTVIDLIKNSEFNDDKTMRKIHDSTVSQITALRHQQNLTEKTNWLKENYQDIFTTHYPSVAMSQLLYPQVTLLKETAYSMIFDVSCIEKSRGKSFRLLLTYEYRSDLDRWQLYSDE